MNPYQLLIEMIHNRIVAMQTDENGEIAETDEAGLSDWLKNKIQIQFR